MSTVILWVDVPATEVLTSNQRLHWGERARRTRALRWRAIEREKARLARSVASAREIETKRARLADLDAEIARLDPPDAGDIAAFTGSVHPTVTRRRNAHLTDTRVARLALYHAEAERLRAWLEAVA